MNAAAEVGNNSRGTIQVQTIAPGIERILIDNAPLNVLTQAVRRELGDAFLHFNSQRDTRCVVFASGTRAFCAGADLSEFPQRFDPVVARRHVENAHRMICAVAELDIPVIAAVRGSCLGGGLELALACSSRIAERSAQFALPEIDRGVWPGTGGIVLLERLVGPARAKRIAYGGERLSAEQARSMGLVDEVVNDGALESRALELASQYAGKAGASMRTITQLIDRDFRALFRDHLQFERERFVEVYQSDDAREGNRAFFEKRQPLWHHR